ncbi:hypothetical protein C1645_800671 [Glomus cerebriforme]|uniref:Uncharacterized protein n=1 Tax=Glomus cerebriforme TaxID=658196 RepID=A0A397TRN3_9GLOM|nr:hypothetical protein C1645_800671 [Glomus cerebriforme]
MNLAEFFRGYRRSEPTILYGLKLFMMIILIACLTGYLAIVIIDVNQDAPIIMSSFTNINTIRPPNFIFKSSYNFTLNCLEGYNKINDTSTSTLVNCDLDLTQPSEKLGPDQLYFGFYQPAQNVLFNKVEKSDHYSSLIGVTLGLVIIDNNYAPGALQPEILAFDSEYDPFSESVKENRFNEFATPEYIETTSQILKFNDSIIGMNTYALPLNQYLGGLGLMGGAWGLAAAIYTLLFGADALRPWGIIQLYCCGFSRITQNKLKKTLPMIPFYDTSYSDTKNQNDLSLAELQSRIVSLELFLQDYVVDVNYLNSVRDKSIRSRATWNRTDNQVLHNTIGRFDNLNTNSMYSTVAQQKQEDLMISPPPNYTQNSTVSIQSNQSDTDNTLYNDNQGQPNTLEIQPEQQ